MKKQSTRDIRAALSPRLVKRDDAFYILRSDAEDAMGQVTATFENVFCGISENQMGQLVFTVQSTKTRRVFVEAIVLASMEI